MSLYRKLCIMGLFGFISGFTITISGYTLNYWLAKEQIDIRTIGLFSIILLPYSINFIWAPIFDTKSIWYLSTKLGHRISWILVIQLLLASTILSISFVNLGDNNIWLFAFIALLISFFSSAQDTVIGAIKTELFSSQDQGWTSGMYIFGYRIGMLLSSSGAIYLSTIIGFQKVYTIFSISIFIIAITLVVILSFIYKQQSQVNEENNRYLLCSSNSLINLIKNIIQPIGSWYFISIILCFLILYRLPDNFINTMINPFLLDLGYLDIQIAGIGKLFGITAAIIGGGIASIIMRKHTIINSLLIFGIAHAMAHGLFIIQAIIGKNIILLAIVIAVESITGGMTMAAYIAFISSLCKGKFRATQYSFFSSMMGLSRSILPSLSGYLVIHLGWSNFFFSMTILTIPSLILSYKLIQILRRKQC